MKMFSAAIDFAKNSVLLSSKFNLRAYSMQEKMNYFDREDKFYIDDFSEYKFYNFVITLIFQIMLQYNFIKKKPNWQKPIYFY